MGKHHVVQEEVLRIRTAGKPHLAGSILAIDLRLSRRLPQGADLHPRRHHNRAIENCSGLATESISNLK